MYSNIRSRAGLVTLVFVLISISLVSAIPLPISAPQPGPSSSLSSADPSHNDQDYIQHGAGRIARIGQMSRAPAATRALFRKHNSFDTHDDQPELVRRASIFTKIKHGFQKAGQGIKHAAQKIGSGVKKVAQKIGSGVKKAVQKVGGGIKKAAQKVGHGIKSVAQKAGRGIKKVAQKVGHGIKRAAQKVGHGVKKVAQKVGHGIKSAAQKVGHGVKKAAQKVKHFVKTTGAKVAKFGLKVLQTWESAAGKVVGFIPEIGKPLQKAADGIAKVAGVASDHIHAKLSPKLQKGMNVMNKANKVMGYIPVRRDLSEEEETFQQRDDVVHSYHFEPEDIDILEDREESYFDGDYSERYLDWE